MPRFFRRLAVGQLDIPDLLVRTDELAAFVTAAAQAYGRDPDKIAALGFSNGANIAVSLLLRQPRAAERGGPAAADPALRARVRAPPRRHRRPHRRRRGRPVLVARADPAAGRGAGRRGRRGERARRAGRGAQPRPRRSGRTGAVGDGARAPPAGRSSLGVVARARCRSRRPGARSARTPPASASSSPGRSSSKKRRCTEAKCVAWASRMSVRPAGVRWASTARASSSHGVRSIRPRVSSATAMRDTRLRLSPDCAASAESRRQRSGAAASRASSSRAERLRP